MYLTCLSLRTALTDKMWRSPDLFGILTFHFLAIRTLSCKAVLRALSCASVVLAIVLFLRRRVGVMFWVERKYSLSGFMV